MKSKLWYFVIAMIFLFIGYGAGSTPQPQVKQQEVTYRQDLYSLATTYGKLYKMCESKYQAGADGNYTQAFELKGQMTMLENDIKQMMEKYNFDPGKAT